MKSCEGCKYVFNHHTSKPCWTCYNKADKPNWIASKDISELIESAERKAFQAGWERCLDWYEVGEVREYLHEDFEQWKKESK